MHAGTSMPTQHSSTGIIADSKVQTNLPVLLPAPAPAHFLSPLSRSYPTGPDDSVAKAALPNRHQWPRFSPFLPRAVPSEKDSPENELQLGW